MLTDRMVGVPLRVQTGSEAHTASYPTGTVDDFLGDKATRAGSLSLTAFCTYLMSGGAVSQLHLKFSRHSA
jgi:hypothetical protein